MKTRALESFGPSAVLPCHYRLVLLLGVERGSKSLFPALRFAALIKLFEAIIAGGGGKHKLTLDPSITIVSTKFSVKPSLSL
jgi:hypothetical protein